MDEAPIGTLVHVLVEGRAPAPFFQLLVISVAVPSTAALERAAASFLEREGARFVELDAEETRIVDRQTPPVAWLLAELSPEGVYAASGRIYASEEEEEA